MFAEGIDEVKDTFLHELGHICTHNNKSRGHGPEWKQWCHVLGLPNVDTYHSIEAMSYKRRPKKVVGNCHTCEIQIWRRKKLQKNLTYICLQCNGYITKL
jgi:predicted SprT family Zn-dependent metalloprotease